MGKNGMREHLRAWSSGSDSDSSELIGEQQVNG